MLREYEIQFRNALSQHPDLLAEFDKQPMEARDHWLVLMEQMRTTPDTAVLWFKAYLQDAGTGRTPLVGL